MAAPPEIWFATTTMHIDYLRPTPLGPELTLHATVTDVDDTKTVANCTLAGAGKERAQARVEAVQVPDEWRRQPT